MSNEFLIQEEDDNLIHYSSFECDVYCTPKNGRSDSFSGWSEEVSDILASAKIELIFLRDLPPKNSSYLWATRVVMTRIDY